LGQVATCVVIGPVLTENNPVRYFKYFKCTFNCFSGLNKNIREERRLRVFENRVLGRIFGPKRDEVTGDWRKLHNEELHGLYSSPSMGRVIKARRMRWAGHVARLGW
jgi:hypothetical protein